MALHHHDHARLAHTTYIHCLQSALDFSSAWKGCLKEELPFLLQSVVFNLLKLRPEEVELMETSPWEFMVVRCCVVAWLRRRHRLCVPLL